MLLQLTMLGTGSAFSKSFGNNNALLELPDQQKLLIDCGHTAMMALHQLQQPLEQLEGVIVTHLHADHVGGLEELAFRRKFSSSAKPTLYIADTLVTPLWEHCLRAGLEDQQHRSLADFFEVQPLVPGTPFSLTDGLDLTLVHTDHIPGKDSYSLLWNQKLFYSADMTFAPDLLQQLHQEGTEYILHECQLTGQGAVHTTLDELLSLPASIQSCIQLMHYGDEQPDFIGKTGSMTFLERGQTYRYEI
ncbi:MBL fold metallo-hydrolase [Marinicrinis sediminis]|uniref:MBL fold metallo-hydrolase n=1 Tax=Marinicrinis sediminis TaxID=1652465 RepID=A0ABW5R6A4_9BACL